MNALLRPLTPLAASLAVAALATLSAGCPRKDPPAEPPPAEGSAAEPAAPAEPASEGSGSGEGEPTAAAPAPAPALAPVVQRRPEVEESRALAAELCLAPPDPLLVADLLTRADVREVTRFEGELLETTLEGIAPSEDYNALRLQAGTGFGFALQLWQLPELRHVTDQFRRLRETYFDSTLENSPVGNEAFSADFEGIRHYAFLHRASKSIAVVTCDRALCDEPQLRALAQRVANRL